VITASSHDSLANKGTAFKAYFLQMAKVQDPFAMSNVLSTIGILAIITNSLIIVKFGRRRVLLMTGLLCCGLLQLIVAVVYDKQPGTTTTGKVIISLSCLYMFSYNVGTQSRQRL
jgi:hypothetical protein